MGCRTSGRAGIAGHAQASLPCGKPGELCDHAGRRRGHLQAAVAGWQPLKLLPILGLYIQQRLCAGLLVDGLRYNRQSGRQYKGLSEGAAGAAAQ
jgi:hypothetical protein